MSRQRRDNRRLVQLLLFILLLIITACVLVKAFFIQEPEPQNQPPQLPQTSTQDPSSSTEDPEQGTQNVQQSHLERKERFYTVLVSGVDDGNGGCDTNILLAVDATNNYVYGVSIPRDTKTMIGGDYYKINAAYSIGGMDLLAEEVSEQLGIPVDYTVLVDLQGFVALVDAIGGVDFQVPVDMDYDDPIQNLSIHISKGMQHLNGEDALKVVRFRHNNDGTGYGSEDIGRMQTQQNFLKAVAKQTLKMSNLSKIDDFVKIFHAYVETDLTLGNLAWLGSEVIQMGAENINFSTLPNEWRSPYVYLNEEEVLNLVNEYLNPYVEDRIKEDLQIFP